MAVLDETGHAIYGKGRPKHWRYQPIGNSPGLGMYESDSLIIEMQVGRTKEFLSGASNLIRKNFGGDGPLWLALNLYPCSTKFY